MSKKGSCIVGPSVQSKSQVSVILKLSAENLLRGGISCQAACFLQASQRNAVHILYSQPRFFARLLRRSRVTEGRETAFSHHSPFFPSDRFAAACSPVSLTFKMRAWLCRLRFGGRSPIELPGFGFGRLKAEGPVIFSPSPSSWAESKSPEARGSSEPLPLGQTMSNAPADIH